MSEVDETCVGGSLALRLKRGFAILVREVIVLDAKIADDITPLLIASKFVHDVDDTMPALPLPTSS